MEDPLILDTNSPRPPAARTRGRGISKTEGSETTRVLVVASATDTAEILARQVEEGLGAKTIVARDAPEIAALLGQDDAPAAALVALDGSNDPRSEEIIAQTIAAGIPTLVLAHHWDAEQRDRLQIQGIVDYFLVDEIRPEKRLGDALVEGDHSPRDPLDDVVDMLRRLKSNPQTQVLVVDDSRLFRRALSKLLLAHRFTVFEAVDGLDGLRVIETEPDLRLMLTDFEMPGIDGVELVHRVRALRGRDDLAIIGLSTVGGTLTPRFLKSGADDFLSKPFEREEFYCRIYRSLETVEHIQAIQKAAFTDPLTQLANRLFFFKSAPALHEKALAGQAPLTVAMVDIDHFKAINDTYGHAAGDAALRAMAQILETELADFDLVARIGGEEFCAIASALSHKEALARLEALRAAVEAQSVSFEKQHLKFTISIGAHGTLRPAIDTMINEADQLLYQAKEGGRNRLIVAT